MTNTVSLMDAQANLKALIDNMAPGDELIITDNQKPIAKLTVSGAALSAPRKPGNCKGMIKLLVEDDEHMQGFEESAL